MKPAVDITPRQIVVEAGIDERAVLAAWALHQAFAAENEMAVDGDAWAAELRGMMAEGLFNLGIAWDGDKAVGVCEMHLERDPLGPTLIAWGRRAYVLPEYRQADVFTALFNFGVQYSDAMGVDAQRAIASTDWYGAAMRKFYEANGFKVIGYVMERRP